MSAGPSTIRCREILFDSLHEDPRQPEAARRLLEGIEGVCEVRVTSPNSVGVRYDLSRICLEIIEDALRDLGFHLDNGLLARLRRALCYYCEEAQRASLGCPRGEANCTREVFMRRYERLEHGCRDGRPPHWRHYH